MGVRVDKYIENNESASIEVKGKTYTADVVVGADGKRQGFVGGCSALGADTLSAAQVSSRRLASLSSAFTTLRRPAATLSSVRLFLAIPLPPADSPAPLAGTAYSADLIRANPLCAHLAPEGRDSRTIWIGPDMHFIHGTSRNGKEIHWLLTHLDTADVEESWMLPGNPEDALAVVKDWDPVMSAGESGGRWIELSRVTPKLT